MHFDDVRALYDLPGPVVTHLLRRGDALTPGPVVEPGVLKSLATPVSFQWTNPAPEAKTSGRRLAFANWLTQRDHPLTSRVLVNRVWLHHFGRRDRDDARRFRHSGRDSQSPATARLAGARIRRYGVEPKDASSFDDDLENILPAVDNR